MASRDSVALALRDIMVDEVIDLPSVAGGQMASSKVTAREPIGRGHKLALEFIAAGSPVFKYGQIIGVATRDVYAGEHVHLHNLAFSTERGAAAPVHEPLPTMPRDLVFSGYRRRGRRAGTRNHVVVVASVNCSATVVHAIADRAMASGIMDRFSHVHSVTALSHQSGCAIARSGESHDMLRRTLIGAANNPNVGGALFVGLGCEVVDARSLLKEAGVAGDPAFAAIGIQEEGGTAAAIQAGLDALESILTLANESRRSDCAASDLVLGLQCGGSDGWSGLSCNPALGHAADMLVAAGGTVLLSETPEIIGAEHLLLARAASADVAAKLEERVRWWNDYTGMHGVTLNNNPSPGNIAGGLTTIAEKSLGAVAKAGRAPLSDVIRYAEPVSGRGLVFMDSPGFDPCSATGQIASGATLIAFTTGRGSAFGARPTPSIKLSSNSEIYRRMPGDIDVDCGSMVTEGVTVREMGELIFAELLAVASGQLTKSETNGYGRFEFVPWNTGAVL